MFAILLPLCIGIQPALVPAPWANAVPAVLTTDNNAPALFEAIPVAVRGYSDSRDEIDAVVHVGRDLVIESQLTRDSPALFFLAPQPGRTDSASRPAPEELIQRAYSTRVGGEWAALTSNIACREPDPSPGASGLTSWETGELLRVPVAGESLFIFGQFDAGSPSVEQQKLRWTGRTGVGVKVRPGLVEEVRLRGGPAVRYDDSARVPRGQAPEQSELFLEVAARVPVPLVGPINVEYVGVAVPAATPNDRDRAEQDLKFALPFSPGSQFHVGAKVRWEDAPTVTPWTDRMQLYMGLQMKR